MVVDIRLDVLAYELIETPRATKLNFDKYIKIGYYNNKFLGIYTIINHFDLSLFKFLNIRSDVTFAFLH